MSGSRWGRLAVAVGLALTLCTPVARADVFRDVAIALDYAGFDLRGDRNLLSGGADARLSQDFVGNPIDFGAWDVTLRGPVSLDVSTGGRYLSQFDVGLSIDLTGNAAAGIPGYELNYDVGSQSTQIQGSLLVDAAFSLNGFGFYDFELTYSSRQDVARRGRFADDDQANDFDIGPISVSGNIFADVLAAVTQPLFDQAGRENPFAAFSASTPLSELFAAASTSAKQQLADGLDPAQATLSALLAGLPAEARTVGPVDASTLLSQVYEPAANQTTALVPEPTVLILMLLAAPAVFYRRPRKHRCIR